MSNIKTVMHAYYFDTAKPADRAAYAALSERLQAQGLHCFKTWGGDGSHYDSRFVGGRTVELETRHLFADQWNTAPVEGISDKGLRVFDWAEDYPINFRAAIKRGHYLEQVPAMAQVRAATLKCGYCGAQHAATDGKEFCDQCLDSAYLKDADLFLLRLKPCGERNPKRAPLTDAERAELAPLYAAAQVHGMKARDAEQAARRRERVAAEYAEHVSKAQRAIENAATERDGYLWLLDRGINTDNVIFYKHTGRFSFGWRSPITGDARAALLDALARFPFPYDVESTKKGY